MITITFEEYEKLTEEEYCEILNLLNQFGNDINISKSEN